MWNLKFESWKLSNNYALHCTVAQSARWTQWLRTAWEYWVIQIKPQLRRSKMKGCLSGRAFVGKSVSLWKQDWKGFQSPRLRRIAIGYNSFKKYHGEENLTRIWQGCDRNLMGIWQKSDGNLMGIWWESDGNLTGIWQESKDDDFAIHITTIWKCLKIFQIL